MTNTYPLRFWYISFILFVTFTGIVYAQTFNHNLYYLQDKRVPMTHLTLSFFLKDVSHSSKGDLCKILSILMFDLQRPIIDEMIVQLYFLGARPKAHVGMNSFQITVSIPSRNLKTALKLIRDILYKTNFSDADITPFWDQYYKEQQKYRRENLLRTATWYAFYKNVNLMNVRDIQELKKINGQKVQNFYSSKILKSPLLFQVISDLPKIKIKTALRVFTKNKIEQFPPINPEKKERDLKGGKTLIIESYDKKVDQCYWVFKSIDPTDPDFITLRVIIDALGGDFDSLLHERLREEEGLCYYVIASIEDWLDPGYISFYSRSKPKNTEELFNEFMNILKDLDSNERFWKKITDSKMKLKNLVYTQTLKEKIDQEITQVLFGLPVLDQERFQKKLDQIDRDSIKQVITRVLSMDNMIVVLVGGDPRRLNKIANQFFSGTKKEIRSQDFFQ